MMQHLRTLLVMGLVAGCDAGWGKKKKEREGAAGVMDDLSEAEHMEQASVGAMGNARDYEMENMARHKAGELNTAELGLENMKQAMKDPSVMKEMADMMKDPENQRKLKEMMADPAFQAQAKAAAEKLKASGGMPDMQTMQKMMNDPAVMEKARAMAEAMGMAGGGMGGAGGMGGMDELSRLRAENDALKARAGL
jgi:hypothetical protein